MRPFVVAGRQSPFWTPQQQQHAMRRDDAVPVRSKEIHLVNRREFVRIAFILGGSSAAGAAQAAVVVEEAAELLPNEERVVKLFEKNTYSVVNVFDTTLRPQINLTGSEVPEGNGTGIVWDQAGHIVTNYHVVGSALSKGVAKDKAVARVSLLVGDGVQQTFRATLVGADKSKDIAVLKVNASPELLHPMALGRSSGLKVGQGCLAIGNPFGFDHTLTVGVVSGLNRDIVSPAGVTISGGIQTDAAINPGNSGGPLLDSRGNLIGLNAAIFTRNGTSAGVGFAIPVDVVARVVPQLIKYGKIRHASLNIQLAPEPVARQLNVKSGSLVLSVPETSNAGKAGLVPTRRGVAGNIIVGDVITAVDDVPVKTSASLMRILDNYQVGDTVKLKVAREESITDVTVTLEDSSK